MDTNISSFCVETADSVKEIFRFEFATAENSNIPGYINNKYKIRSILIAQIEKAKKFIQTGNHNVILFWGFFMAKLANHLMETEGSHKECKNRLLKVVEFLESLNNFKMEDILGRFGGLSQYVYNSLAVVADKDAIDENQSALFWLEKASSVYMDYKSFISDSTGPTCWETLSNLFSLTHHDCLINKSMLETSYTATLFMLSQVYASKADKQKSADLCQKTLSRQLQFAPWMDKLLTMAGVVEQNQFKAKTSNSIDILPSDWLISSHQRFEPKDWVQNVVLLSKFYVESKQFEKALECLMMARTIASKGVETSEVSDASSSVSGTKLWAHISSMMAEYALELLKEGSKSILSSRFSIKADSANTAPAYGSLFNQDTTKALQEAYGENIQSAQVMQVALDISTVPTAYPAAARIFRWTCRSISEAQLYFQLDGHCSEAIELIRGRANAYDCLAAFETDLYRKCCMQKRRVDLLEDLLVQLNPAFYMRSCRIMMSECGEALTALRDLNEEKMRRAISVSPSFASSNPAEVSKLAKKVNGLGQRALEMYKKLLASFLTPKDQTEVEFYEEEWLRYVLMAHFYSARLHSKTIVFGPLRHRVENLIAAQKEYGKMLEVADRHASRGYQIASIIPEVAIARDMAHLLSVQIAKTPLDK